MFAFRFGFAHTIAPKEFLEWMQFLGMILTIVLITAGGNFINDYFDVRVDRINKPDAVYVETKVKRRVVILAHIVATTLGVLISFFVGKSMHSYLPFIAAIGISIALGLYTPFFKKRVLSGNLLVSLCIGVIPIWSVWPQLSNLHIAFWTAVFAGFAFTLNFSREIVKDIEDAEGDAAENYKTLPVVMGTQTARIYALLFLFAALIIGGVTLF
ncbi:MAG: UbiA family prenyltransferase, partial [Sediminibacterium sp.]